MLSELKSDTLPELLQNMIIQYTKKERIHIRYNRIDNIFKEINALYRLKIKFHFVFNELKPTSLHLSILHLKQSLETLNLT